MFTMSEYKHDPGYLMERATSGAGRDQLLCALIGPHAAGISLPMGWYAVDLAEGLWESQRPPECGAQAALCFKVPWR